MIRIYFKGGFKPFKTVSFQTEQRAALGHALAELKSNAAIFLHQYEQVHLQNDPWDSYSTFAKSLALIYKHQQVASISILQCNFEQASDVIHETPDDFNNAFD